MSARFDVHNECVVEVFWAGRRGWYALYASRERCVEGVC